MVFRAIVILSFAALLGVSLASGYGKPHRDFNGSGNDDDDTSIPGPHIPNPHGRPGFKLEGKWSSWSSWSRCSKTCDGGSQSRSRVCQKPKYLKYVHNNVVPFRCSGSSSETRACNTQGCPVFFVTSKYVFLQLEDGQAGANGQTAQSHAMAPDLEAEDVSTLPKPMEDISVKARVTREYLATRANTVEDMATDTSTNL
ncbi:hypothetical protein EB796_003852 [Bugula neritina]|uniref:Uncharacterized protein n=1 Tax=Bugula neritina TaxID=10212 RepID=A0A7J7KHU7_BUGNE|nr:hypothetical protein EB796_003852 [Bugula neritina]